MNTSSCHQWCQKHGLSTGLFILRVFLGILFVMNGWMKLGNMEMFIGGVASLGFPAATFFAYAAALTELLGGIALLVGFGVRVAAGLLAVVMLVAFFGVHGASLTEGGAAFTALGGVLALAFTGAGSLSLMCCLCKGKKDGACCQMGEGGEMKGGCCKK